MSCCQNHSADQDPRYSRQSPAEDKLFVCRHAMAEATLVPVDLCYETGKAVTSNSRHRVETPGRGAACGKAAGKQALCAAAGHQVCAACHPVTQQPSFTSRWMHRICYKPIPRNIMPKRSSRAEGCCWHSIHSSLPSLSSDHSTSKS